MDKDNNLTFAIILSVLLHAGLALALFLASYFNAEQKHTLLAGENVKAVVISRADVERQAREIQQKRTAAERKEKARIKELENQSAALEQKRKAAEEETKRLEKERLKAERDAREAQKRKKEQLAEEKRAQEAAKIAEQKRQKEIAVQQAAKQKADAERKAAEQAKRKAEAEQKAAEAAKRKAETERKAAEKAKRKAEAERKAAEKRKAEAKRKAAEAARKQKEQDAALAAMMEGLETEQAGRNQARGQQVNSEIARYAAIYRDLIMNNLLIEERFRGQECKIRLRLAKNGLMTDMQVRGGNDSLCRATQAAVYKVGSFPMPKDPKVIEQLRSINLTVEPE
ncbi:hypothetical protein VST7929_00854 [Vibrio stylophorae]|uniref:Cell envelope integrity protein TolA n=1 Tax=Vibrio stylophorae TaxID=659351 RepID=A0ABM8ZRT1_9VIBR|nr:cell envelope integrity protein TolA [Vibrio stylophorae]CAH0533003.1 hypothetical protein VST7929_00854 [Vibrio stylophorae]